MACALSAAATLPFLGRRSAIQNFARASPALRGRGFPNRAARVVQVQSFKFFKQLGLKKPAFLPDFGVEKRLDVLRRVFGAIDRRTYEELLAPDCVIVEEGLQERRYSREDWINLMCNYVGPAVPDFSWTFASDGAVADDGFVIVSVQAVGHHIGTPLAMADLPPVPPSGSRFSLPPEFLKVKVEDGQIKEMVAIKGEHTGPLALYDELARLARLPQRR